MADYNPSVALGINAPDPQGGLNTLNKIMELGQRGLSIQGQKSENQVLAAKATEAQQNAKEKMSGAQLLSDPVGNGLVDADGNPTKDAQKIIYQAMPTTGADHYQGILSGAKAKVEFAKAANGLSGDIRNEATGVAAALAADPKVSKDQAREQLDGYIESKKGTPVYDNVKKVVGTIQTIGDHLDEQQQKAGLVITPGKEAWRNGYITAARSALGPSAIAGPNGLATPTAGVQNLGGTNQPVVQAPAIQGGGITKAPGATTNTIPPGFELTEDPITHNKYLWNRQTGETRPFGSGAPSTPRVPGGGPVPPSVAPPQRQIGEAAAQEAQVNTNFQTHQANVKAASAANQQLDQIKNVSRLLDEGVKTGQGAQAMSQAEQALSNIPGLSGLAGADSQAAKFDLLNKFLERIGADYGSLNGSPAKTDAGAESLRSQIGSTGYNPEALRAVMKYTAAQYQAAKAKDNAEQTFFAQKGNGILNQDQFEKQWRNSYDPRVFQLANEPKEVAKAEIQKMNPADRASFLKKYAELKSMGAAPQ